jgi:hypothetical protein
MMAEVTQYLQTCFSGANLPASSLLVLVMVYWLMLILAGLDLDFLNFDLDVDADADVDMDIDGVDGDGHLSDTVGIGFVVLRFFNIGRVPIMVWVSIFAITYWLLSVVLDRFLDDEGRRTELFYAVQYGVRNFAVAVVLTKIFTQPLRGKFDPSEPNKPEDLIGKKCVVTTTDVTQSFGQAQYETEAAPLLLNVRTREKPLAKGDVAVIVDHDAEENIYFVTKANSEV